jgi:hypothetical protein
MMGPTPGVLPCCTRCGDLGLPGGNPWLWQCRLPATVSSWELNVVAEDGTFLGTCLLKVTANIARVSDCNIAQGWSVTSAVVHLGEAAAATCDVTAWRAGAGRAFASSSGRTGSLRLNSSVRRAAKSKRPFVSVAFNVVKG